MVPSIARAASPRRQTLIGASNRAERLALVTRQMQRTDVFVLAQAVAIDRILTVETVSTMGKASLACGGAAKGCVVDCCSWARTASYRLGLDGGIVEIRFLTSRSYWGAANLPHVGELQPSR